MPHATIIGAGIAGTATAIGLTRTGWHVTLHERTDHPETSGAALGIWPTALAALDELGVGDALRAVATPQAAGSIRRPDGAVLAALSAERATRRPGDHVHLVARRDLATLLAAALPPDAVRYGSRIAPAGPGLGGLDDHLDGGADVVVVADGVFSAHRTALLGRRYQARYTGQSGLRGRVAVTTHEVTETWGPGRRFGITPYLDGTTNWYASLDAPPGERAAGGDVAMLRELFAGWHDPIGQVLDVLTEDDVMRHDLYDVHPHLPTYIVSGGSGNAVLVGDAAHGMTPDLGRGACEALVDAATLARCLAPPAASGSGNALGSPSGSVAAGLARYDRLRRRPTQLLQTLARGVGRTAHARHLTGMRDLLLRVAR
ncbi:2-polyprenyl-6-methoxyphenol hydroxylase [Promicromonospora umidemergens]|uniref:FAD dependent oxidoreductase domain-containing protein n=1 Tax=Promicromonospora umidemergens TaxID=629679 RepID=A0ABP8XR62_9MICO|nr:FAD-dependent oxidoreductase [Promicromonospora umidemergens]MCP2281909.1 2-polyprenyl-6-methoxyphenol hydroxylase [Promicromonospora umidemergens]